MKQGLLWAALVAALLVLAAGGLAARGTGRLYRTLTRKDQSR